MSHDRFWHRAEDLGTAASPTAIQGTADGELSIVVGQNVTHSAGLEITGRSGH
jgi:hypothetical protein